MSWHDFIVTISQHEDIVSLLVVWTAISWLALLSWAVQWLVLLIGEKWLKW